jgi:hypothetical protein
VHMNGRIYDPVLGRFLSADPFIQAPGFTLSYNRYAYVVNNPLVLTDPSGYSWFSLPSLNHWLSSLHHAAIRPTSRNLFNALHGAPGSGFIDKALIKYPWINTIGIAAATAWGGPWGGAAASAASSAYMVGLQGGGDDDMYKAGATSFAVAAGTYLAGGQGNGWQAYVVHAVVGCASNSSSSSNCARGAAAAVVGKYVGSQTSSWGEPGEFNIYSFAATTVAGGATSAITGGKFADGAKTAAAVYLFNELSHTHMNRQGYTGLDSDRPESINQLTRPVVDPPDANASLGYSGQAHLIALGMIVEGGATADSIGTGCGYVKICAVVGPGLYFGAGSTAGGGQGALTSGERSPN